MRKLVLCLLALFISLTAWADEGMWLPIYIKQMNEQKMQKLGLKLSAEDIYSVNNASLKDAIVSFGGFCTGEIVSNEGLVFTNHHCGYDAIAGESTVQDNYLRDGFWASSLQQERPIKDLFVRRLVRMEDVTDRVMKHVGSATGKDKDFKAKQISDEITSEATKGSKYEAEVETYFAGNNYYLLVYEVFKDVRLVGTAPKTMGKFGGETDNWMWPRHTADFSVFRIYANADNEAAEYSPSNVPYKPKKFLTINAGGVDEGDFTMVMGFPGSTNRYMTSDQLTYAADYRNPVLIDAFGRQLKIMKREMDKDDSLSLVLASTYASLSNTHKYFIGQQRQMYNSGVIDIKRQQEEKFMKWVNADNSRKEKYGDVVKQIADATKMQAKAMPTYGYYAYGLFRSALIGHGFSYYPLYTQAKENPKLSKSERDSLSASLKARSDEYFAHANVAMNKDMLTSIISGMNDNIPKEKQPDWLQTIYNNRLGMSSEDAARDFVNSLYANSILLDQEKMNKWLKKPKLDKLAEDPLMKFVDNVRSGYIGMVGDYNAAQNTITENHTKYVQGLREMAGEQAFYPDANSTFRLTYGNVTAYEPADAVVYEYYTTHVGILEKYKKGDEEFGAPEKQIDMFRKKEFGPYATNDSLRINFLTTTDITGGNSGSPVLDGKGQLVGLAFDGNWESMIGDLYVDPAYNRTIAVDIRYVLWTIDTFANSRHIMEELKIVRE